MRSLFLLIVVALFFTACSVTGTNLKYHAYNTADSSFWVTEIIDSQRDFVNDKVIFWRCQNYAEGPTCVQAKLVTCKNPAECELEVSRIDSRSKSD
ncbi:MAG TPA: hypothetical protein PLV42_04900 [bacterium]|nr:hypothetical protein [bacterium]